MARTDRRSGARPTGGRYGYRPGAEGFDGNAARVLERRELLDPRIQQDPRRRVRSYERPHLRQREAGRVSVFAIVGFLAVGVFALMLLLNSVKLITLADQVMQLDESLTELKSEETRLQTRYELAYDLGELEKKMTESGAMVKLQRGQVSYLDLAEPDSVVAFNEEGLVEASGVRSILNDLLEYFR